MRKYGRTFHLPHSPGATSDDKIMPSLNGLKVGDLLVTEKMDGENTTIHAGGCHARSPDGRYHSSRDWVKAFAAGISPHLADDERIIGENLYARHSITYHSLPSYFLGFAWIVDDEIQSWDMTLARFKELNIQHVPTMYRGPYKQGLFDDLAKALDTHQQEGFVVRRASAFAESAMPEFLGKYVREGHVQTDVHWMKMDIVPNGLAGA